MKYTPQLYAEALLQVLEGESSKNYSRIIRQFFAVVRKNGDTSRAGLIVDAIQKRIIKKDKGHIVDIELARPIQKKLQQELVSQFSKKDLIRFSFNEELIAGVRITIDGERECDNSLLYRLRNIFDTYAV